MGRITLGKVYKHKTSRDTVFRIIKLNRNGTVFVHFYNINSAKMDECRGKALHHYYCGECDITLDKNLSNYTEVL